MIIRDYEEYLPLIEKAMEIVYSLGSSFYEEGYYNSEYCGKEFTYDKFKIRLFDNDSKKSCDGIDIKIDNTYVFKYYFGDNTVNIREGRWIEILNIIYNKIPDMLNEKNRDIERKQKRVDELLSLREYFDFYVYGLKYNKKVNNYIDNELARYKISVQNKEVQKPIRNSITGDEDYYISPSLSVISNEQEVAEFKNSEYDVFPNIDYYVEKFVPGPWVNNYKRIINKSMEYDNSLIDGKIERTSNELIKKLTK